MKILYASCRYDPLDPDAGSGVDFNVYETFKQNNVELKIVGPFTISPSPIERVYRKIHRLFSKKLYAKFSIAYLRYCACAVDKAAAEFKPDAIFTHNLIPLVYGQPEYPVIYWSEAVLKNMHPQWPTYSKIELMRMLKWEKAALRKSDLVITASQWAADPLLKFYKIPESRVQIIPIPCSLPTKVIPEKPLKKRLNPDEIHLLAVAKDFNLKGIDIAIEIVNLLQSQGIHARLRVVGQSGKNQPNVEFMGLFKKDDPGQLEAYAAQFVWADFLIHAARYEAAGIVCSEAAAFGVPTITNSAGGLATTVEHGVSGIVLPKGSAAEQYAEVIKHYYANPNEYATISASSRTRYEQVLNWEAAGKKVLSAFESMKHTNQTEKR